MKNLKHIVVLDSIPFMGGSKVATENILRCLNSTHTKVTVLSADQNAWLSHNLTVQPLHELNFLTQKQWGLAYFARHLILLFNLIWLQIKFGRIDLAIGASGPGNDLALYWSKKIFKHPVMQLVHGSVGQSNTIARCLKQADHIFYLDSAIGSIDQVLSRLNSSINQLKSSGKTVLPMVNGLSSHNWPKSVTNYESPRLLWAASLLKWKGLDTLISALNSLSAETRPETNICYIRPKQTELEISQAPIEIKHVQWFESPSNLDEIRQQSNVFISTSHLEPFGLSILEAMAAGHCALIPADGAYWDQQLTCGENCIKYLPDDSVDLYRQIKCLIKRPALIEQLGKSAQNHAETYRAESLYLPIVNIIEAQAGLKVLVD